VRSLIPVLEKLVFLMAGAVLIDFGLMSQTYPTESDMAQQVVIEYRDTH